MYDNRKQETLKNRGWYSKYYWCIISAITADNNSTATATTITATTNKSNNNSNNYDNVIIIKVLIIKIKLFVSFFLFGEKNAS